jgi:hypothetical protein
VVAAQLRGLARTREQDHDDGPAPYVASFFDGPRTRRRRGEPTDGVLTSVDGRRIRVYVGNGRGLA